MTKEEIKHKFLQDHKIVCLEKEGTLFHQDEEGDLINLSEASLRDIIEICGYGEEEIELVEFNNSIDLEKE